MEAAADFSLERGENGDVAVLTGDWTTVTLGDAGPRLADALKRAETPSLDQIAERARQLVLEAVCDRLALQPA